MAGALPAQAADYPAKPIRIVVPYAAGGSTDALARMIGEQLGKRLGQAAIVENKPGASEQIAITSVTKAAPDGYTILLSTLSGLAVNPGLYGARLPYDPQKDLTPVLLAATVPSVVVVHPSLPVKTMAELGSHLKANPGKISYASAGNGTPSHLGMEYYKKANGVDPVHVPYKGGAPALQEVMGGQVQLMMALVPEAMPMVRSGRLRALAVTSPKRLPAHPEVPTVAESGGKDFDMTFWYAFMAPAGTPAEIVGKLNRTIDAILQDKDLRARMAEMSLDVAGGAPARVTELIRSDSARWKKVIDEAGIRVD
ncbi:MAG: tripartite tricarboxylate transporter substrate binding protein [Burkholderiaceae bacterium]|nr:tripartite tricarboxylate transporter substrate binding protein [Burkholderiaceae bacterium]